jgi:hypothetical protein
LVTLPAPVHLAHVVAPRLAGLRWAIGGSTLLWSLGLEAAPQDLDVFVVEQDFDEALSRLEPVLGGSHRPAGFAAQRVARFAAPDRTEMDLVAGIAASTAQGVVHWSFDAATPIEHRGGLPWMRAEDWLTLYRLFGRPHRVAQLERFLQPALSPQELPTP